MTIEWSEQQNDIFDFFAHGKGNLVIRARAGTGKTTVAIEGMMRAPEQKILFVAFNTSVVNELKSRIKNPRAEAKTSHSLGRSFIMRAWNKPRLDEKRGKRLAAEACGGFAAPGEMIQLVDKLAELAKGKAPFGQASDLIAIAQEFDLEPDKDWRVDGWTTKRVAACARSAMDAAALPDGTIDFNDMLYVPVVNRMMHGAYDLVIVDESQDFNASQTMLARGACREGGRIVVIGDDRQAIYGFRGADSGSIDRLKKELDADEMGLTITRRCPQKVVRLAQRLVPDFEAAEGTPDGRKNAPLAGLCLRILRRGVRAQIKGRDIGTTLASIVGRFIRSGALTVADVMRHIDEWEREEIERWTERELPVKVDETIDKAETLRVLAEGVTSALALKSQIETMFSEHPEQQPCVMLSSIHRSKGLEADTVYVLQDTLYPRGDVENIEERNLEYVAITRTKRRLVWVSATIATPEKAPLPSAEDAALFVPLASEIERRDAEGSSLKAKVIAAAVKNEAEKPYVFIPQLVERPALSAPAAKGAPWERRLSLSPAVSASDALKRLTEQEPSARKLRDEAESSDGSRHVTVYFNDMAHLLAPVGFSEDRADKDQRVLTLRLDGGATIRVYSSVMVGEQIAAGASEDSIRIVLLGSSGKPLMKRQPYLCRTSGWASGLLARIGKCVNVIYMKGTL